MHADWADLEMSVSHVLTLSNMARQEQMEEEFLTCNICFDVFKEPKTLACLHRFCQKCLHNYITGLSTSATNRRRGFPCPLCREFILAPNCSKPPSEWASLLKTDFHLKSLIKFVESRKDCLQTKQVSVIEHPCSKHKNQDCDLYCVDCSKLVCHLCAGTSHRGCNQVVTSTEAANDRRATLEVALHQVSGKLEEALALRKFRDQCLVDLEKQKTAIEKEIKKQGQLLHLLVAKEENILLEQLQEKYDALQDRIALKVLKFEESLETMKNKIQIASCKNSAASDFELLLDDCVDEIIKEFQNMDIVNVTHYRRFFKNLLCVRVTFHKRNISSIPMGDVVFSYDNKGDEGGHKQAMNPARNATAGESLSSNNCVVETSTIAPLPLLPKPLARTPPTPRVEQSSPSPVRQGLVKLASVTAATSRTNSIHAGTLRADSATSQPTTIASATGVHRKAEIIRATNVNTASHLTLPVKTADAHKNTAVIRTINTTFREDASDPSLRDLIVVVPGNTVMVTDWSNQCVKSFHVRRERDARLALGGKPWAITQMTDMLAAVSLPLSTQICIVKISPTLSVHKSFVSAKKYSGLATLNNAMLVASGGSDPPSVDIINLYGEVLKTFSSDNNGLPMFKYPAYVSVTPSMLILVSDRKRGAVFCISLNGETKFHFQPDGSRHLQEPSGVTSNLSGRIFVAESRGLLLLTPDGQLEKVLVRPQDDVLHDPRGVALDTEGLVYVTSNSNDIKVFKIE